MIHPVLHNDIQKRSRLRTTVIAASLLLSCFTVLPLMGCGGGGSASPTSAETTTTDGSRAVNEAGNGTGLMNVAIHQLTYLADELNSRAVAAPVTRATTYPQVTTTRGNNTVTITIDYGTTPVTTSGGHHTVSGVFVISANLTTGTGSVAFNNVVIDGHSVTGSITLSNIMVTQTGFTATAQIDLTYSGYGRVTGTVTISKASKTSTQFTVPSSNLTLMPSSSSTTYAVTITNWTLDPATYGNLISTTGTSKVTYSEVVNRRTVTVNVLVTYNASSPTTGQVSVSVNGAPAVTMTLPGF